MTVPEPPALDETTTADAEPMNPKVKAFSPPDTAIRQAAPKARGLPARKVLLVGALLVGGAIAFALMTGLSHKDRVYASARGENLQSATPPMEVRGAPKDYAQIDLNKAAILEDLAVKDSMPADYPDLSDSGVSRGLPPASLSGAGNYTSAVRRREVDDSDNEARNSPILFGGAIKKAAATSPDKDPMTLPSRLQKSASPYILQAGAVIPAALRTGVNSDAPGRIIAQVTAPVYDSFTGEYLLIPQGALLIGRYDSGVQYGDRRVRIVWNRLTLPNGWSLDLASMAAADASGASGLSARVDDHLGRIAMASVLSGALSTAANSAKDKDSAFWTESVGDAAAQEAARAGGKIVDRELDVRPTLKIPGGAKVRVLVERDLVLKAYSE